MKEVAWSGRRGDLIEALRLLSDSTLQAKWRKGVATWPGLTEAVHWLVDDTWLDERSALSLIPEILVDEAEAEAIDAAVTALLIVPLDLGPTRPDSEYLDHPGWQRVVKISANALASLTA